MAVVCLCTTATAQNEDVPRVKVAAFEGPGAKILAKEADEMLSLSADVITTSEADFTVLISGAITRRKGRLTLALQVTAVTDPEIFGSTATSGRTVAVLRRGLSDALDDLSEAFELAHAKVMRDRAAVSTSTALEIPLSSPRLIGIADASAPNAEKQADVLTVALGVRVFSRELNYIDDIYQQLYGYSLPLGPALQGDILWYPGAHAVTRDSPWAHLGLRGEGNISLGLSSDGPTEHDTSAWSALVTFRGRIPLWGHEIGLEAGYGTDRFEFTDDAQGVEAPTPDTAYQFWRLGMDGRLVFGPWSTQLGWAWRSVFESGEIASDAWFPRSDVSAMDGHATLSYAITDQLSLSLGAQWRRYAFTMNPEMTDARVAGGATDETLSSLLQAGWRL